MLTATQNGDAIFSAAIALKSPEEREAYIAQACGQDAVLRRQVQERVAAHFPARQAAEKPAEAAANGTVSPPPNSQQPSIPQAHHHHAEPANAPPDSATPQRSRLVRFLAVLMLAASAAGIGLAIWGMQTKKQAEKTQHEAEHARDQARQAEEQFTHQREQLEKDRQEAKRERDEAVNEEKAEKGDVADMKAALGFFQKRVMTVNRSLGWTGGQGKEVTLRKAVDAADSRVTEELGNQPLAEATIREMLGATYLDLKEPALAVKEYERALALREAIQGENAADTQACRNELSVAYKQDNRPQLGDQLFGPDKQTPTNAAALAIRGAMLLAQKRPAEAEKKLRECVAIREKILPNDWATYEAKAMLGQALMQQNKQSEGEPLLQSGCEGMKQQAGKIPPQDKPLFIKAVERLIQFYDGENQQARAEEWRKELLKLKTLAN